MSSFLSGFLDFVWDILYKLGFLKKNASILLLGLDNAGKTTLLQRLKYGTIKMVIPTQRAQMQELELGSVRFKAWDLGGHEQVRGMWRDYFQGADAIIFMVDSADEERFEETRKELNALLNEESLKKTPFLILANKKDLPHAASQEVLIKELGLSDMKLGDSSAERAIQMFRCSLVQQTGYSEGFKWLSDIL